MGPWRWPAISGPWTISNTYWSPAKSGQVRSHLIQFGTLFVNQARWGNISFPIFLVTWSSRWLPFPTLKALEGT
ncbi:MAG: hypothetical protein CL454_10620 [Acidimicrobiaceae bacterium]|nr:hypothetical protein [Acidimicrobiaceae bacterium]